MFDAQDMPANVATEVPVAAPLPAGTSQPIHLLDRLNAVFKHRRLAGTAFVLVIAMMMVQTYSTIPTFQAQSRVQIQDERTMSVANITSNDPAFWQDADQYYKTQYSILESRGLAKRVVERLNLGQHPDFSGNAPRPRDPISVVRQARAAAGLWVRSLVSKPPDAAQPKPAPDEDERLSGLISAFLGGVQVVPQTGTRLVTIFYRHHNPRFSAEAANALAEEYTKQNLDLRLNTIQTSLKWIDSELARQEDLLNKSEAALTQYRETNNAQSLDDKQNIVTSRLTNVNDQLTRSRGSRLSKETLYNQIKNADPKDETSDNFPAIGNNPNVVTAKNALLKAEGEKSALVTQGYGPEWPALKAAENDVAAARRQLVAARGSVIETARNEYNAARLEESNYAGALEEAKSASVDLERKGGDYKILQRKAETDRTLYNQLLTQQKELSVIANSRANNVQVMERAEVPKAPISPNPRRDWLTALLAGVVVAFGLAFGIEYLDDTVKVPEDITRRLRLPLLGLVPAIRGESRAGAVGDRAARVWRSVPIPAHVAGLHLRQRAHARDRRHEQPAARGQDDDRRKPGARAGAGWLARPVDRRGHAPAGAPQDARDGERRRPVAAAHVTSARPRSDPAHQRTQPAGDYRRTHATEPVGTARIRPDEHVPAEPPDRAVRLGRHRHAAGAGGHGCCHPRPPGVRCGVRDRIGNDPPGPRRACHRDTARQPPAQSDGSTEPCRLQPEQVLLFALLRLPVQELLRTEPDARRCVGVRHRASAQPCSPCCLRCRRSPLPASICRRSSSPPAFVQCS